MYVANVFVMTDYTDAAYAKQLDEKKALTLEEFACFGVDEIETVTSSVSHYRMRAEFRVWHDGDDLDYVMFNQETKEKYKISCFPAASKAINELMPLIISEVKCSRELRHKLFQIDYLSSLSGEVVVSLLYHKQLIDAWEDEVKDLKARLSTQGYKVDFIGRARKQKRVVERDYVVEQLRVHEKEYVYQQIENSFTQPNGRVAEKMLEWAVTCTQHSEGDLLELYCGNGNFSVALAQNFDKVLATELAKPSVESAQWNIRANNVANLKIARLSAEELTQAMRGVREFHRLKQQEIYLNDYQFSTVFVDPPRAGMDIDSVKMVQKYHHILYISCNPITLKENLQLLSETHEIREIALFDQFPYTHHREIGVFLKYKG